MRYEMNFGLFGVSYLESFTKILWLSGPESREKPC